jgi:hypothetical protein
MKKIILFSFFVLSSVMMTSCTADSIADAPSTQNINVKDTGGQQSIPPPPPPPNVGSGL